MMYAAIYLVLAFGAGIFLADLLPLRAYYVCVLFLLPISYFVRKKPNLLLIALVVLSFFAGAARLYWAHTAYEQLPLHLAGETLYLEGVVEEKKNTYATEKGEMSRYVLTLEKFSYTGEKRLQQGAGKIYVTVPAKPVLAPSTRIGIVADVRALSHYKNPGLYDARHHEREQGICLKAYASEDQPVQILAPPGGLRYYLQRLREYLTSIYQTVLSRDQSYILSSLLFGGHYDELPPALLESFSSTGLIHILSVSGSHISLLLAAVQVLGRLAGLRGRTLFVLSAGLVLFYGALAEFTAPVIRSAIMGILCAYSLVARRQYTGCHALALAALSMLAVSPYLLFDLTFQLSCGASAGIVLLQPRVSSWLARLPKFLAAGMAVCFCAQILLVPLLIANFSSLPLYTLPANLTVGPILDFVILLGLFASLLSLLVMPAGQLVLWCIGPLLDLAVKGNYFLSSLPHSRLFFGAMPLIWVAAWYLAVLAIFFLQRRRCLLLTAAAVLFLVPCALQWWQRPQALIRSFDLGNDRAACIVFADRTVYLWYNKSRWSNPEQAACVLTPALRYAGIFHLDTLEVCGDGAKETAAQLAQKFRIGRSVCRKELPEGKAWLAGPVPYYHYAGLLPEKLPGEAVLEIDSLAKAGRTPFPQGAAALIVHRSGSRDAIWKRWREKADLAGIPFYTPETDGLIEAAYKDGTWTFRKTGGDSIEAYKNHLWK